MSGGAGLGATHGSCLLSLYMPVPPITWHKVGTQCIFAAGRPTARPFHVGPSSFWGQPVSPQYETSPMTTCRGVSLLGGLAPVVGGALSGARWPRVLQRAPTSPNLPGLARSPCTSPPSPDRGSQGPGARAHALITSCALGVRGGREGLGSLLSCPFLLTLNCLCSDGQCCKRKPSRPSPAGPSSSGPLPRGNSRGGVPVGPGGAEADVLCSLAWQSSESRGHSQSNSDMPHGPLVAHLTSPVTPTPQTQHRNLCGLRSVLPAFARAPSSAGFQSLANLPLIDAWNSSFGAQFSCHYLQGATLLPAPAPDPPGSFSGFS